MLTALLDKIDGGNKPLRAAWLTISVVLLSCSCCVGPLMFSDPVGTPVALPVTSTKRAPAATTTDLPPTYIPPLLTNTSAPIPTLAASNTNTSESIASATAVPATAASATESPTSTATQRVIILSTAAPTSTRVRPTSAPRTSTPKPTATEIPPTAIVPTTSGGGDGGTGGSRSNSGSGNFDHNGDGKVTCADFSTQSQAREALAAGYNDLDRDKDGIPCESLP